MQDKATLHIKVARCLRESRQVRAAYKRQMKTSDRASGSPCTLKPHQQSLDRLQAQLHAARERVSGGHSWHSGCHSAYMSKHPASNAV